MNRMSLQWGMGSRKVASTSPTLQPIRQRCPLPRPPFSPSPFSFTFYSNLTNSYPKPVVFTRQSHRRLICPSPRPDSSHNNPLFASLPDSLPRPPSIIISTIYPISPNTDSPKLVLNYSRSPKVPPQKALFGI